MHLPFLSASSQPDLEIIIPGRPEQLLRQTWRSFQGFSRHSQVQIAIVALLGLVTIGVTFTFTLLTNNSLAAVITQNNTNNSSPTDASPAPDAPLEDSPTTAQPAFINLQPIVDQWTSNTKARAGLMIYDLDNNQVAAQLNANQVFSTASIYKLFFTYVGYQDIDASYINPDQAFVTTNDYRADTYTFSECLDLMIRESYNGCADPIRSNQRLYRRVESLVEELGLTNTTNGGLSSTPADLADFLKFLYRNHDLSTESWASFQDSLLNQPPTEVSGEGTYDWRQGLPAGFSETVKVYDKVGWAWADEGYWTTYNDATIVEFPDLGRHYIIVLLTANLREDPPVSIQKLSTALETAIRADSR